MIIKQSSFKLCLTTAILLFAITGQVRAAAVIDLLIVYTDGVAELYSDAQDTRFNHLVETANQIYSDSGVDLELNIKHTVRVSYTETNNAQTALNDITQGKGVFNTIAGLREVHEADMVILFRPYHINHGSCGLAWVGGIGSNGDFSSPSVKSYQYSHVAVNSCGDYVAAHELGHNMGLKHSRKQDGSGGTLAYALGYGVNSQFTTIMAYQSEFNVDYWSGKVYKFSNPDLICMGQPCGIDRNLSQGADARFALNITGPQIANFLGDPNATVTSELQIAYEQMIAAQEAYATAEAILSASDIAYDQKSDAEKAAKLAITDAKKTAMVVTKSYEKTLKDYEKSLKMAAKAQLKATTEQEKYNTSTNPLARERALQKYNQFSAEYTAYTSQATTLLSQAQSQQPGVESATNQLTSALTAYETAKQSRTDEKSQNQLLKKDLSNKKKILNVVTKQYTTLLKNWS